MKYHPTYGLPGTQIKGATLPEQLVDLGRGWEWWPSVLWQVVWTWIVSCGSFSTYTKIVLTICRLLPILSGGLGAFAIPWGGVHKPSDVA